MSGALMRRWWRGIYADHRARTRREESPRRFSRSALRFAEREDEARLRSTWPAPDGRGRPAPPRRGRAAGVRSGRSWLPMRVWSCPWGERVARGEATLQPTRDAASAHRQFEKCAAGAPGRGGAVSPLTFGTPVRPTDGAPACAHPPAAAGIVSRTPETHFSARRPRRGGCDVASPHQTRDPNLRLEEGSDSFPGSKAGM
jgi:hypothetical protein